MSVIKLFQFGEPLGSYRHIDRFGHHRCFAGSFTITRFSTPGSGDEEESVSFSDRGDMESMDSTDRAGDPGTVLDISVRKQREASEDLYKRVLVNNTARAAQREISRNILQSLFC